MLTDKERRNLERVKTWAWTWNNAVDRMVDECYAPDCVVVNMMSGVTFRGREALRQIEHSMRVISMRRVPSNACMECSIWRSASRPRKVTPDIMFTTTQSGA